MNVEGKENQEKDWEDDETAEEEAVF